MPHALIVDDDRAFALPLAEWVGREGFQVRSASSLAEARALLAKTVPDLILLDLELPDGPGLDLLRDAASTAASEVVIITGFASVDSAVEALRQGALDYLTKPVDRARLKATLANVARTRALKEEIGTLREELRQLGRFGPLIGASRPMQKVYDLIAKVGPTDVTVLIRGESGTGKELVAEAVHRLSQRRDGPFLPVNCGAISPNLIESELFGHERGSFTGAERTHRGYFERASGGTLFLDEITEMPIELQVKLLRALETGTITRTGGTEMHPIEVRVIAATNRSPEEAVAESKLRKDLLYRLNVFPISLPPLRERGQDVELLADYFLGALNKREGTHKRLTARAVETLRRRSWPGNVRELRNVVQRAFILAEEDIGPECLAGELPEVEAVPESVLQVKVGTALEEIERRVIVATLQHCHGNKTRAAEVLGISLKTLYNRLNAYAGH